MPSEVIASLEQVVEGLAERAERPARASKDHPFDGYTRQARIPMSPGSLARQPRAKRAVAVANSECARALIPVRACPPVRAYWR
jgi:hypothetical protein